MDKILITGANGNLGSTICSKLSGNYKVIPTDVDSLDIRDKEQVDKVFSNVCPDFVIHCAAIVNADFVEQNKQLAYDVNVTGTKNLSIACGIHKSKLLFFSSDYVFDGQENEPYGVDSLVNPINYYGVTKILGEQIVRDFVDQHFIFRISWLFGSKGYSFFRKMADKRFEDKVTVVNDQIGSPTYAPHLANAINDFLSITEWGTYHITNEGFCSWYEYAKEIFSGIGSKTQVVPVTSSEYSSLAKRPLNSKLDKTKSYEMGMKPLPSWKEALSEAIQGFNFSV